MKPPSRVSIRLSMNGLGTNVLVRYITHDDPVQTAKAERVIDALSPANPGSSSLVAVVELVWRVKTLTPLPKRGDHCGLLISGVARN